jgi:hypothetical protein
MALKLKALIFIALIVVAYGLPVEEYTGTLCV